jgi:hypothetical protein
MSIEAMKLALEALKRLKAYGNVFRFRQDEQNPYDQACEAIAILRTAIEQAERQQALDKKAENARELGLDYEPVPWIENMTIDSTNELSKPTTPVQEPVADSAFEKWWDEEGSAAPKHRLDCEEHCYQIAKIAWSNGAYKAQESYPPAAPVQEPVANAKAIAECLAVLRPAVKGKWPHEHALEELACYTTPQPQREWVGLTDADKDTTLFAMGGYSVDYIRGYESGMEAAEDKLKEKNSQ